MAPEQYRSALDVDGRADVYALGCILFELLAGEPLHPRGKAAVETTLAGIDARPSTRGKEVPPELEALCIGATTVEPARRIATARQLGDQIQRFLDGDRDMAQRRELALAHFDVARKAFEARAEEAGRRVAMRNAGRALALDPNLAGAAELVTRLMLEPPDKIPPEVEKAVEEDNTRTIARSSRIAAWGYLGFLALVPTVFNGSGIEYVLLLVGIVVANIVLLVKLPTSTTRAVLVACANAGLVAALARVFAPFFIAPAIAAVITMALVNTPKYEDVRAVMVIAMVMTMAILAPWALERVGVVSTTTWMGVDSITFAAPANAFAGAQAASATLVLYVVALIFAAAFIGHAMRKAEKMAKHAVHLQAWQLRQLVT
jgi:serine/threonine-protein kinase